jgi:hypothetical protein
VVDLVTDEGEALAARYRVFQVPAVLLINEAGAPLVGWSHLPFAVEILEEVEAHA